MLGQLVPKLDFAPPLADFLHSDPYKIVRASIQYGFDLGQNDVNGRTCRTFAFVEKDIDWQVWIECACVVDAAEAAATEAGIGAAVAKTSVAKDNDHWHGYYSGLFRRRLSDRGDRCRQRRYLFRLRRRLLPTVLQRRQRLL